MDDNFLEILEEKEEKKNIKKYRLTIILGVICALLAIFYILLPSKTVVKEVKVKTIESKQNIVEIQAYFVESGTIKSYVFTANEDSYSNLLKATVEDILSKSSGSGEIKLLNTYFSDDTVYFELDNKNISENLREAIQKTTFELLGETNVKFI